MTPVALAIQAQEIEQVKGMINIYKARGLLLVRPCAMYARLWW